MAEWLLYEHDDGCHAVAPSAEAATFTKSDPAWHRVGPVEVPAPRLSDADIDRIQEECDAFFCESCDVRMHEFARAVAAHVSGVTTPEVPRCGHSWAAVPGDTGWRCNWCGERRASGVMASQPAKLCKHCEMTGDTCDGGCGDAGVPEAPAGWKLVPVTPTPQMRDAAVQAICYGPEGGFTRTSGPDRAWAAMLSSSPCTEGQRGSGDGEVDRG